MASSLGPKGSLKGRTKVKTGCATCRIRKVKCDENKPFCRKCVNTGRACDGYESPFRIITGGPTKEAHVGSILSTTGFQGAQHTSIEIGSQEIDLLNRYFSTKSLFDVPLCCDEEARQVLQASLTDAPTRHAVLSLKALWKDLEKSGDASVNALEQNTDDYHHGLQQYSMALRGLATSLQSKDPRRVKAALLCCQVLISIEQVRKSFAAMAQHIIQGLRIMREYRARAQLVVATDSLVPAHPDQMPMLDVFIIKLFAAPCKFANPSVESIGLNSLPAASTSSLPAWRRPLDHPKSGGSRDLRTIAPNMRTELTRIATLALEFLDKVSRVESVEVARQLLAEKTTLLQSLTAWQVDLELTQVETGAAGPESVSTSFMRLFHLVLTVILLGALDSSTDLQSELRKAEDQLQDLANNLSERIKAYNGAGRGQGDRSNEL